MNEKKHIILFLVVDYLSALASWTLFYMFRKVFIEPVKFGYKVPLTFGSHFLYAILVIPFLWLLIYYVSGFYRGIYKKTGLDNFSNTFVSTFIGVIIIFFTLILDDTISSYRFYYFSAGGLYCIHFAVTFIPRQLIISFTNCRIKRNIIGFPALIAGCGTEAFNLYSQIKGKSENLIVGYIKTQPQTLDVLVDLLPCLGKIDTASQIVREHKIKEVLIAIDHSDSKLAGKIIGAFDYPGITIKIIPSLYQKLRGKVKLTYIFDSELIRVTSQMMPVWQENLKGLADIVISAIMLLVLSPLCLLLALGIKCTSPGSAIYSHERIGRYGKVFKIYKFRSMYEDAEENGPELATKEDKRITPLGRFMRKLKLDEIPNFFNVLKGDMAIVGPRPERKYYIDQIVLREPTYLQLLKVKPGITSLGQVKFGYAENVDEMVRRFKYDILYMENMSIWVDMKIVIYTFFTILKGKGI